jgi:uncharacterized protein (DUF952 family)
MIEPSAPELIYKIATQSAYAAADGMHFYGMPVDAADGFIHFSNAEQLRETLKRYFAGQSDLVLIAVRPEELGPTLKWEPSRGGALFPHLYGPMPLKAVAWTAPIAVAEDGTCALPESVR